MNIKEGGVGNPVQGLNIFSSSLKTFKLFYSFELMHMVTIHRGTDCRNQGFSSYDVENVLGKKKKKEELKVPIEWKIKQLKNKLIEKAFQS